MKKDSKIKKITGLVALASFMTIGLSNANAQVGMSGNNPDKSAALDLNATNKGLLVPRVNLASLTDKASINGGNPAVSLMVYNTNATLGLGYYYWDGIAWKKLISGSDVTGDNLGNHTATKVLDMAGNKINNVDVEYFKDQATGNANSYGLYKNNGVFGFYASKNSGNDLSIDEATRKTTVNNLAIGKGTDGSAPAAGFIATSVDASGNVVWKNPADIVKTNQVQSDWNTTITTDPAFIKNKPLIPAVTGAETKVTAGTNVTVTGTGAAGSPYVVSAIATGDNLGNHTATQALDMAGNKINNVDVEYFKDQATGNANTYGLYKNNGVLGFYASKNSGNDLTIDEGTRKTTVNNLAIGKGTDGSAAVAGYVASAVDATGNVKWTDPATIASTKINAGTNVTVSGAGTTANPFVINSTSSGDNLGNHKATDALDMTGHKINNVDVEYFKDQVTTNNNTYGLYKNAGVFGVYNSSKSGNDLAIDEESRKTTVNKFAINNGTDDLKPAIGNIAVANSTSGDVVWKDPAAIFKTNQIQSDWSMTTTTDPSYIKNKPSIPTITGAETKVKASLDADNRATVTGTGTATDAYVIKSTGDNLGDHTATQNLNMSNKNINDIHLAYFKDETAGNVNSYGLYKRDGALNIYSTKTLANDMSIDETSHKTTVNNLAVTKGTDESTPGKGKIATSLDDKGNIGWTDQDLVTKNAFFKYTVSKDYNVNARSGKVKFDVATVDVSTVTSSPLIDNTTGYSVFTVPKTGYYVLTASVYQFNTSTGATAATIYKGVIALTNEVTKVAIGTAEKYSYTTTPFFWGNDMVSAVYKLTAGDQISVSFSNNFSPGTYTSIAGDPGHASISYFSGYFLAE